MAVLLIVSCIALTSCGTPIAGGGLEAPARTENVEIQVSLAGLQAEPGRVAVDAVGAVRHALAQAKEASDRGQAVRLVFPKAQYHFFPEDSERRTYFESNTFVRDTRICPILIEGITDLVLDGQGSEFIFHGPMQPITIDRSRNIQLKNFSIDWDIPLTAQAQVVATTDEYIDIRIAEESPFFIKDGKIIFQGEAWESQWWGVMEFEKDSHLVPQGSGGYCIGRGWQKYRAEEIEPHVLRLHHPFERKPAVGNYLVMRHNRREHAGMFFFHSEDIVLEDINVYHTGGLGLLGQFCENLSFRRVNVIPNPRKNRYLSSHDDGIHISNCRGLVAVEDCTFEGLMDDPINVHGTSVRVVEIASEDRLVCRFMHHMSVGQLWGRPGESVGFLRASSLETIGEGIIRSWKAISTTDFEITFEEGLPEGFEVGDALENLTWAPEVRISNCTFSSCRARGVLLSTPGKSVIEGCTFRSSGAAILIAGDANQWYESGAVTDVLIRDNIFESSCLTSRYQFGEGVISICPEIPEANPDAPFHRNIRIENNVFHAFDYPVLYAFSTQDISFIDNTIMRNYDRTPWHRNRNMLNFTSCKKIRIEGTRLIGDVLGRDIKLRQTDPGEVSVSPGQGLHIAE